MLPIMSDDHIRETSEEQDPFETKETFVCKAVLDKETVPLFGKEWKRAKRFDLVVDSRGITFGETTISYQEIDHLTLRVFESALFIKCCVISLKGKDFSYHFAMKYSEFWEGNLPIEIERIEEETPLLYVRKALIFMIVVYILYELIK